MRTADFFRFKTTTIAIFATSGAVTRERAFIFSALPPQVTSVRSSLRISSRMGFCHVFAVIHHNSPSVTRFIWTRRTFTDRLQQTLLSNTSYYASCSLRRQSIKLTITLTLRPAHAAHFFDSSPGAFYHRYRILIPPTTRLIGNEFELFVGCHEQARYTTPKRSLLTTINVWYP